VKAATNPPQSIAGAPIRQPQRVPSPEPPTAERVDRFGVKESERRALQTEFFKSSFYRRFRPNAKKGTTQFSAFLENRKFEQQQAALTDEQRDQQKLENIATRKDLDTKTKLEYMKIFDARRQRIFDARQSDKMTEAQMKIETVEGSGIPYI